MGTVQLVDVDVPIGAAFAEVRLSVDILARNTPHGFANPESLALVHKRRGKWEGWRWRDVSRTIDRLSDGLRREGMDSASRFALSGAFEPDLILLALAAHAVGATLILIDRHAHGSALRTLLDAASPTHAFVQDKKTISSWIASGYAPSGRVPLYTAQSVAHDSGIWQIKPLADLAGPDQGGDAAASINLRRALSRQPVAWVEEGTEWATGLETILSSWLEKGGVLAAPEVSASSLRDRHEIQPDRIFASAARRQQLQDEVNTRLPAVGSLLRRLADRSGSKQGGVLSRWLAGRIATLHGLPAEFHKQDGTASPQSYGEIA